MNLFDTPPDVRMLNSIWKVFKFSLFFDCTRKIMQWRGTNQRLVFVGCRIVQYICTYEFRTQPRR